MLPVVVHLHLAIDHSMLLLDDCFIHWEKSGNNDWFLKKKKALINTFSIKHFLNKTNLK